MLFSSHSYHGPSRVIALLGPTNTGKTHLAMERMLGHASGMIGFPLRLLARENYDRAVKIKGAASVALLTGEEKIVPPQARYFLCTVESMPLARSVAFLGIDEIQMAADPDRGHVFTDRLLHARGQVETMLMGAATIRPLLRRLVPEAEIVTRPRFSMLGFSGHHKLQRLPPRSAIVAFTAADVYAIAELIRRQRGGAAVVLGALSPRTRNAQVAMYQAGEVDYLVATDAIGMGLNMDINHVAFAGNRKFDGRVVRELAAAELAQIAGRAGRHMNDGTFGTTADSDVFDAEVIDRIENHQFEPLRQLFWRNSELRYTSLAALQASLAKAPGRAGLTRAREADDEQVLAALGRSPDIADLAQGADAVRLLWDVCQVPDFRKVMSEAHARLLGLIYRYLMGAGNHKGERLPTDWVAKQVANIDRVDGDIETLMQRIANIRTWTYVSHRADWLEAAAHWQERTRAIEDRLSDALHKRLIQRFVDRRTSVLLGRRKNRQELIGSVTADDIVVIEGETVGRLEGFRFVPDADLAGENPSSLRIAAKAVHAAAHRVLRVEVARRVRRLEDDSQDAFTLCRNAQIVWRGAPVARLLPGHDILHPGVEPVGGEILDPEPRERLRRRLVQWVRDHLEEHLRPLFEARRTTSSGAARGLAFQVAEALGSLPRRCAATQVAALNGADRKALRALGLNIGQQSIFFPRLVKPAFIQLRAVLWSAYRKLPMPDPPAPGRVCVSMDSKVPADFYEAIGYRPLGSLAVRVDSLERFAAKVRTLAQKGAFVPDTRLSMLIGCDTKAVEAVLEALGYEPCCNEARSEGARAFRAREKRARAAGRQRGGRRRGGPGEDSPFAKLRDLPPVR
jgi:ATP-dependent RNA helicase SUPV3L1/SUV3